MTTPYPFQLEDVEQISRLKGRVLIANEMGTGKSLTSLLWLVKSKTKPCVVVCPAGLKWNWEHEATTHLGLRADVLEGTKPPRRGLVRPAPLLIINYDVLHAWLERLKDISPQCVILDECHYIKSRNARRTKACQKLCKGVPHVLALSGTPLTNRPAELFPILNLLRPDLYPSFWNYAHKHCGPRMAPWGIEFKGATRMGELHKNLTATMMIRRRKADVLRDLPEKVRIVVPLQLPAPAMREYRKALNDFLTWLSNKDPTKIRGAKRAQGLVQLGELKRLTGELKLPLVTNWVDDFLEGSEEKLIQFAIHKKVISHLRDKYHKDCVVVDGSVPSGERKKLVDAFQHGSKRIFIGNIQAAGTGLTLTAASTLAFCELGWTPGEMVQAEDRPHRIGQKNSVFIYYLVARGTIEEKLAKILQDKQGVLSKTLDGGERDGDLDVFDRLCEELKVST